ncbi:MAG: glycosyltransferase [Planctomycetota bacterium]
MLVTRHFWPHAAGRYETAAAALTLASYWTHAGIRVEVATPRYEAHWPSEFMLGDVRVHRVGAAPRGDWSNARYVRHLGQWLSERRDEFDAVVADSIRDDVPAVVASTSRRQSETSGPIGVAVCAGVGADADWNWCQRSRSGARVIKSATALSQIITFNADADRKLVARGLRQDQLVRVPPPWPRRGPVTQSKRRSARAALASANSDLVTDSQTRVLLWCGEMSGDLGAGEGVAVLVGSARILLARYPDTRIWFVGDGPMRDWIHSELKAEGVRSMVALPGSFPNMKDVYCAADAIVHTDDSQMRATTFEAVRYELPLIAANRDSTRMGLGLSGDETVSAAVSWYDPQQPKSFRTAVRMVWDDHATARELASGLSNHMHRRFGGGQSIRRWRDLLQLHSDR